MFGGDLNMDWTCVVAMNAGAIDSIGERYKGGETRSVDFSTMVQWLKMMNS